MKYVLDASIAVKWVLSEPDSSKATEVRDAHQQQVIELISPDSLLIEVAHALTRAERRRLIKLGEAEIKLADLYSTCPRLVSSFALLGRAIAISSRNRISVYDSLYVALADVEQCAVLTADARLYEALRDRFAIQLLASLELPS